MSAPAAPPRSARPFVLVVDDSEDQRGLVRRALEDAGYGVLEASDGHQALRAVETLGRPAAVVLDLGVAGLSGQGFLASVRRRPEVLGGAGVVVLTGAAVAEPARAPVTQLLRKPAPLADVLAAVGRACARD